MDILNSNYVNESFINPTYGERMGLTYRQAKGKLSLKDKIRLKLMKYLGRSRNSLKDKLQDKSLQAAGYAIRRKDAYMATNPGQRFVKRSKEGFKSAVNSKTGQKVRENAKELKGKASSKIKNLIDGLKGKFKSSTTSA